jgi:DNA helicase HerA-like ATPase
MQEQEIVRLPTTEDRIAIIGQTGSGKTVGALWHLSLMPVDAMRFLVIDFKREKYINAIPYAKQINIGDPMPTPGVYIIHPRPTVEDRKAVEDSLWNLLDEENVGIFLDEGFMLKDDAAFETILMQGRSKNIPVIVNAQRPVWLSRFVLSESGFIQVFFVGDDRDKKTVSYFTPLFREKGNLTKLNGKVFSKLPKFHSWYYDVGEDKLFHFGPVPNIPIIMDTFERKLRPQETLQNRVQILSQRGKRVAI